MPPDSKETEPVSSSEEAFLSTCENTGIVLEPCCTKICDPTPIFSGVDILDVPGCYSYDRSVGSDQFT